jgi:DNA-binding response OmpR family regulator
MSAPPRIILVDDEPDLVEALAEFLALLGHRAEVARSGAELERLTALEPADLVVLDLGLPGEDGRAILERLRRTFDGPVAILTGRNDPIDRVLLLELGADDFIAKPIEPREFAARINGLLRRCSGRERPQLRLERSFVDLRAARMFHDAGHTERLTAGEVALVRAFMDNAGRVLSRDEILALAPAGDDETFDRAIDSRISRLRRKLDTEAIRTVRGEGYAFDPPPLRRDPEPQA